MMSSDIRVQPAVEGRRRQLLGINQLLLIALAVALCHCFRWNWLRALTQSANLGVDSWFGVYMQALSPTTITYRGLLYQYQISCTFVDVWFGLVPILWLKRQSIPWNVCWLMVWALSLLVVNISRLSLSDVLFAYGVPWWVAHSIMSGLCYYLVWCVARRAISAHS